MPIVLAYHEGMPDSSVSRLELLDNYLVNMSELVGTAIQTATQALLHDDLALAERVIANDAQINEINVNVERLCFLISTMQAPMAGDLRRVVGGLKIASSLERMGDLAVHIAKQVRIRYPRPSIPDELRNIFAQMGKAASDIVAETARVLATKDPSLKVKIIDYDDFLDQQHRLLFTVVLDENWSHGVEAAIDVTLLSRFYERFGDHAVSVARRVSYVVTGEPYDS